MTRDSELAEIFKGFQNNPISNMVGIVTAIDDDEKTIDVTDIEENVYYGVQLQALPGAAFGLVVFPPLNATVVFARIGTSNQCVALMFSAVNKILVTFDGTTYTLTKDEISTTMGEMAVKVTKDEFSAVNGDAKLKLTKDGILFNEGSLGGLPKLDELKENLEALKTFVMAMHQAMPSAFTAVGAAMASSGAAGGTSYSQAMLGKNITLKDMENPKVKQ